MKRLLTIFVLSALLFNIHSAAFAKVTVPADIDITLEPVEKVTSRDKKDFIKLKVKRDVVIQEEVVFKEGAKAIIKIVDNTPSSYMGVPGSFEVLNGHVYDAHGNKHDILISQTYTGKDQIWAKVLFACGLTIILCPLCLFGFVKGTSGKVTPEDEIEVLLKDSFVF